MNASAVSDARRNAEINGITNCRFVSAKVRIRVLNYIKINVKVRDNKWTLERKFKIINLHSISYPPIIIFVEEFVISLSKVALVH